MAVSVCMYATGWPTWSTFTRSGTKTLALDSWVLAKSPGWFTTVFHQVTWAWHGCGCGCIMLCCFAGILGGIPTLLGFLYHLIDGKFDHTHAHTPIRRYVAASIPSTCTCLSALQPSSCIVAYHHRHCCTGATGATDATGATGGTHPCTFCAESEMRSRAASNIILCTTHACATCVGMHHSVDLRLGAPLKLICVWMHHSIDLRLDAPLKLICVTTALFAHLTGMRLRTAARLWVGVSCLNSFHALCAVVDLLGGISAERTGRSDANLGIHSSRVVQCTPSFACLLAVALQVVVCALGATLSCATRSQSSHICGVQARSLRPPNLVLTVAWIYSFMG